jgi:ArsR family transcriptional regulator, arsenate/arsenite/antimonite-responsive transcriptional repressor
VVSIYVDMMSARSAESGLGPRLERLTGEDAECCVTEFRGLGRTVQRRPEFRATLRKARALADPSRLTALSLLKGRKELCACEIQAALGVSHATVSHHMRLLAKVGLVDSERRGKWVYYRLRPGTTWGLT